MNDIPLVSPRTSSPAPQLRRVRFRTAAAAVLALLGVLLGAGTAWADMGQSPPPNYVVVQQAMSYLVNDPSAMGAENALAKVNEVLSAPPAAGVDVAEVRQARSALQAGDPPPH